MENGYLGSNLPTVNAQLNLLKATGGLENPGFTPSPSQNSIPTISSPPSQHRGHTKMESLSQEMIEIPPPIDPAPKLPSNAHSPGSVQGSQQTQASQHSYRSNQSQPRPSTFNPGPTKSAIDVKSNGNVGTKSGAKNGGLVSTPRGVSVGLSGGGARGATSSGGARG